MALWVEAMFDYIPEPARAADEFPFKQGELIEVLNTDDDGWWQGRCDDGRTGYFPKNYVEVTKKRPEGVKIPVKPVKPKPEPVKAPENKVKKKVRRPDELNSTTRYGVWATVSTQYVALFYIVAGLGLLLWKIFQGADAVAPYPGSPNPLFKWGGYEALNGLYCICMGIGLWSYEELYGLRRGLYHVGQELARSNSSYLRGVMYAVLSVPGFLTLPGLLGSMLMILPISLNFVSGYKKEIFIPPEHMSICCGFKRIMDVDPWDPHRKDQKQNRKKNRNEDHEHESLPTRIYEFIAGENPEGQFGRFVCMILYVSANLGVGIWAVNDANEARVQDDFTFWVHMAKFFGYIMDLNFSMLLLPVSRTLIRGIYNCATRDQLSCRAQFFLCLLKYLPLDEAVLSHKLMARVGFFSAVMHTIAHVINFGTRADKVDEKWGLAIWVTGVGLIIVMLFLYSCSHNLIKKSQFELFWGTHMLFPLFLLLILMHGCPPGGAVPRSQCWFGPHYWYWILGPGIVFFFERLYREFSTRQVASLLAFKRMGDVGEGKKTTVLSLSLDKVGVFATEYREGQYAYIMCPPISNFEWHPFTISSCPQQDDVTFHIRVLKQGSWTSKLLDTLSLYCKANESLTVLSRSEQGIQGLERKNGIIESVDGQRLLRIYGPHSAPTQNLTKYGEVYIVTSGIGVTPLNSCMKSVVLHRWKFASGMIKPQRVHFFWVTPHNEIQRFRWFVRTVKDVCDCLADILEIQRRENVKEKKMLKQFSFHVFVTRINEKVKTEQLSKLQDFQRIVKPTRTAFNNAMRAFDEARKRVEVARAGNGEESKAETYFKKREDDMLKKKKEYTNVYQRFWGKPPRDEKGLKVGKCRFTEEDFYKELCEVKEQKQFEVTNIKDAQNFVATIKIIPGRPKWEPFFTETNNNTPFEDVGVCFCGNPFIGKLLEKNCSKFTKENKRSKKKVTWHLHQEVF